MLTDDGHTYSPLPLPVQKNSECPKAVGIGGAVDAVLRSLKVSSLSVGGKVPSNDRYQGSTNEVTSSGSSPSEVASGVSFVTTTGDA